MSPETTFQQRQQQFTQAKQAAQQRYNQLAFWRLMWFIGSVGAVWLLIRIDQQLGAVIALLIGVAGFLFLLKKHQTVRRERDVNHHLAFINQDESARLKRQYLRSETGEQFVNPTHYYSGDLDVFGKHSLFRLLNRAHTYEGQNQLAQWLQAPASPETIRSRQEAVAELKPQLDWRQMFEALAYAEETINQSPTSLIKWASSGEKMLPRYLNVVRFVFPAIAIGLFVAWLLGYVPGLVVIIALGIHSLILRQVSETSEEVSEQTFEISAALRAFKGLFEQAEQVKGDSRRIQGIRQIVASDGSSVSTAIGQLARLTEGINYRRNPYFYFLFGIATLWDLHYLFGLERWRKQHGSNLVIWFDALGELEVINSLAGFSYAHPAYATPTLVEDQLTLTFSAASHPLLVPGHGVANSLSLVGSGQTVLITGSNMSGKSTFLRTVGANVVLALAGAVVSAEAFSCSLVRVFTSMRTQDSLEESTSSFYAELKRLQTLIGLTKEVNAIPVLYFLDEILKGTNSADRHRGAEALIRQMHRTTASGFVSTHDLELGQLAEPGSGQSPVGFVRNYHFQSDLKNGELLFDYKLRNGICESFNASQLMQAIGIEISADAVSVK
ncbi:DNA mismatch repair protein MutS [Spirosoma soli]|uniref:DNA mismatch repair protein MutS n=1 Tax=Spirosoma soli TaxID=1770529 RepID=A0ABW5MAN8_9BACT